MSRKIRVWRGENVDLQVGFRTERQGLCRLLFICTYLEKRSLDGEFMYLLMVQVRVMRPASGINLGENPKGSRKSKQRHKVVYDTVLA